MSERLTLQDLTDLLSDKQNITKKDAETFLRELVALISETIEEKDFVRIKDLGTFKLTPVSARKSVNVNTGETIEIPGHYRLGFVPDKILREGVNKPFSHFESILIQDEEVTFEEKAAKATAKFEEKKAAAKQAEAEKAAQKKETPKVVPAAPKVVKEEATPIVETPIQKPREEKEEIVVDNSKREQELADLSSFIVKSDEEVAEPKKEAVPAQEEKRKTIVEERPIVTRPVTRQQPKEEDEEDEYDYSDYERELSEQRRKRNTWIGVGVAILLILGIGVWGYNNFTLEENVVPQANNNAQVKISDDKPVVAIVDDPILPEEEVVVEEPVKEKEPEVVTPPAASKPAQGSREIVVKSGQTMRALGQEYFGHRSFWVYIFEENRERIKKPDDVYAGMKLTLPSTSKYDIDANDKASISKAERLELKYFGEFSQK